MPLSESERDELHESVRAALGIRGAELFMSTVPGPDEEPASRRDLSDAARVLRGEFNGLRGEFGELRGEFDGLRGEVDGLRGEFGELRGEFGELRGEVDGLRGEFGELRGEVREMHHEMRNIGVRMDAEFVAVRGEMVAEGGRLRGQLWLSSFSAAATAGALVIAAASLA